MLIAEAKQNLRKRVDELSLLMLCSVVPVSKPRVMIKQNRAVDEVRTVQEANEIWMKSILFMHSWERVNAMPLMTRS